VKKVINDYDIIDLRQEEYERKGGGVQTWDAGAYLEHRPTRIQTSYCEDRSPEVNYQKARELLIEKLKKAGYCERD